MFGPLRFNLDGLLERIWQEISVRQMFLVSLLPFAELCSERHGVHVQKVNRSGPTGFSWT